MACGTYRRIVLGTALACLTGVLAPAGRAAQEAQQQQSLEEVRNTVINLLRAMVDKGLLTREQAEALVKQAQDQAAADATKKAEQAKEQAKEEANAIRVPYVPEIVKDQIAKDVVAQLGPSIKQQVVNEVNSQNSLYAALPDWVQHMRWSGDLRFRGEGDLFGSDNATNAYFDYNQINSKGGIAQAGTEALLNTTNDQTRLRLRARFGFDTDLGSGWSAAVFLATGSTGEIIATTNQTLGTYGTGYTVTIDQGYLRYTGDWSQGDQVFTAYGGRFSNPFLSTDLVWYNDLTFEGVVSKYRLNFADDQDHRKEFYLTAAALPLTSFSPFDSDPTDKQKWLLGGQLGADLNFEDDSRLRFGAAYYDYLHIVGQLNPIDSTLYNWTAPTFVQKGNTVYDISNSPSPTNPINLFALASNYRIVDLILVGDLNVLSRYDAQLTLQGVKNIGWNSAEVAARVGSYVPERTTGYRADLAFGTANATEFGSWRASIGYRYLERDAVLDAFNDEDFHLGGTDAKGYTALFDFTINPHVYLRMKYMSANEIDGPRLGIDVWQFDVNGHF